MSIRGLYGIIDNTPVPERSHPWLAEQLLAGGTRILQLRMKGADPSRVLEVARHLLALKERYAFTFILNDDLELAQVLATDGYHGGKEDPALALSRKSLGAKRVIGYSAHSLEEALEAERQGADYVAFGAIFPSPLKGPGHPVQGVDKLREVVEALTVPVVAIGGITRDNVQSVLATGVASIALISALVGAPHPRQEAEYYGRFFAP